MWFPQLYDNLFEHTDFVAFILLSFQGRDLFDIVCLFYLFLYFLQFLKPFHPIVDRVCSYAECLSAGVDDEADGVINNGNDLRNF